MVISSRHGFHPAGPAEVAQGTLSGLQAFFDAVVREGEEQLLADPGRLIALAGEFGSEILGDYPSS